MIRAALVAALVGAALASPAVAAPHKILVLPSEGNADAATRIKLTAQVTRLARRLDGQVTTGDATFADAALAVGCDPEADGCSDQVLTTLGIDELVWATATRDPGGTRVVVHRAAKGHGARERDAAITADAPDQLDADLAPLFGAPEAAPAAAPVPPRSPRSDRSSDRAIGLAVGVGAGAALVVGGVLWASYSNLQDQINTHPTASRGDLADLVDLENRAQSRAIAGDVLVIAGLAAGGIAAYFLLRDHHAHAVAIGAAPIAHGGVLTLIWRADL